MSADGVDVDVGAVDVKVEPVEDEGLDEAQHGLAEEGVEADAAGVLVDDADDGVAQHEG